MRLLMMMAIGLVSIVARAGTFDVDGKRPTRVQMVALGEAPLEAVRDVEAAASARARGVLHEFSSEELAQLMKLGMQTKLVMKAPKPSELMPAESKAADDGTLVLRLRLIAGEASKVVEIAQRNEGELVLRGEPAKQLLDKRWERMLLQLAVHAGSDKPLTTANAKAGAVQVLAGEVLMPSPIVLDDRRLRERFTRGGEGLDGVKRSLRDERMLWRLPKTMTAENESEARGLVVYVHPAETTVVPQQLELALDELGYVCIAPDKVGNGRNRVERMQLVLDAISTAQARSNIDASRVYVVGLSGGGKIGTHVWAAAPEVVHGVVAIVAIGSYEHLRREDGKFWQGDFVKPSREALAAMKMGRIAAITGDKDGNQDYIRKAIAVMKDDGLVTRLDDVAGMGHEMASSERVRDALVWVGE